MARADRVARINGLRSDFGEKLTRKYVGKKLVRVHIGEVTMDTDEYASVCLEFDDGSKMTIRIDSTGATYDPGRLMVDDETTRDPEEIFEDRKR